MARPRTSARLDDIAETAAQLFLDKGFDATSMADLADATGLGKSSLYHHLASKEELLARVCAEPLAELRAGLDEQAAADGPPATRLLAAFGHAARTALRYVAATNLILTLRPTTETGRGVLRERRRQERVLADLVAAAQADGAVRDDVEPLLLTRLVLGTINGLVAWYRPEPNGIPPAEIERALISTIAAALRPEAT